MYNVFINSKTIANILTSHFISTNFTCRGHTIFLLSWNYIIREEEWTTALNFLVEMCVTYLNFFT